MTKKIVHIVGPTGVGKTDLAVELAKKFNGSLISADSVQVYKGLDIISGKDLPQGEKFNFIKKISNRFDLGYYNFSGVKVYILDVVSPFYSFSVFDFLKVAREAINLVLSEKRLPIVVGGTGLYIEKLLSGINLQEGKIDLKLRQKLQKLSVLDLQELLKKTNIEKFNSLNNSDINNPRRLIRAIEIEKSKDTKISIKNKIENLKVLQIGLYADREYLKQKIDKRINIRLANGALREAETLFKNYSKLSPPVKNANGYKQLFLLLKKEIDFDQALGKWKNSEYTHAKNQMTWFKKYGNTKWFEISKKGIKKDIESHISSFLT